MPLGEKLVFALQVSLFGIIMVFLLLIILAVLIMIISRVVRFGEKLAGKKGKKNKGGRNVTIRQGDTLSEIAKRNGTTVKKLKKLNKISGSSIRAGKKLRIK